MLQTVEPAIEDGSVVIVPALVVLNAEQRGYSVLDMVCT
jgi:hypothetical protein